MLRPMDAQFPHVVLPGTEHDELSRQHFAMAMRKTVTGELQAANEVVFARRVEPEFRRARGRAPATRAEVRQAMLRDGYHRVYSALRRTAQEMVWDSVLDSLDRQIDALNARAASVRRPKGSLRLDPGVEAPRYLTAVDIHCMPGNYHGEAHAKDVYSGALYDRGAWVYAYGSPGPLHDNIGQLLVGYLQRSRPDLAVQAVLDMGCTAGGSTLPWCDAYPKAAIHAIDVSASCLRYAHARAESLGKTVHFSQQNAERTDFADRSFDVVVSHLVMHELSTGALLNIFRESRRLLRPGGVMLHMDAMQYAGRSLVTQYIADWDTYNNGEPCMGAMHDLDLVALMHRAGFAPGTAKEVPVTRGEDPHETFRKRGALLVAEGVK